MKCTHFTSKFPLREDDNYNFVKLAKYVSKNEKAKVLFVFDYMPKEDLRSGRMLSGATGELLRSLTDLAHSMYGSKYQLKDFSWIACSYNAYKTAGASKTFQDIAEADFKKRITRMILKYEPDIVVTFGRDPTRALHGEFIRKHRNSKGVIQDQHFFGIPLKATVERKDKSHTFKLISTISLNPLTTAFGKGDPMYLAGYVARNLVSVLNNGKMKYRMPARLTYKTELVDTIPKFKAMLKALDRSKVVGIDTETSNLNRIVNKLLVIQFSTTEEDCYVLPIDHKDNTWLPDEIKYIKKKLRLYFERDSTSEEHIFANAVFDLNRIKVNLGVRFFRTDVYDVFAGEYCLDENMKILRNQTGLTYYSLLNITMQYGCYDYYASSFSKDQRKTIETHDLNEALIEYCALDVITLQHIRKLQLRRAKDVGYRKFHNMVRYQQSDLLHTFSCLEVTGSKTDIEWLFYLKSKDSPLVKHRSRVIKRLNETKGVRKANAILSKAQGAPKSGLFGAVELDLFKVNKRDHLNLLMFTVLKLKPESKGKNGDPQIDKKFQSKYDDVTEVALYNELQKINKLLSSYVKAFIKQWGSDPDMRSDGCIRPSYQFSDVVTGRTSAQKPSLHQIPSRNSVTDLIMIMFPDRIDMGKAIKRMFIVPEGYIQIKVDYAAHEVRGWSITSKEKGIASLFQHGLDLRNLYKLFPTKELAKRIDLEGDVHKINAAYFFTMPIETVDKPKRNSVKTVIFGLIYQQGFEGLAEATGQTVDAIKDLTKAFLKRFPTGVKWFDKIKKFSKEKLYVESPIGRRRHLWAYLMPKSSEKYNGVVAAAERRSVNSPIQGLGSDFLVTGARCIEKRRYDIYAKTKHYPDFSMTNSVHDSLEFAVNYNDFWTSIKIIEEGLTLDCMAAQQARNPELEFPVQLEIDMEIGANLRDSDAWDYSLDNLEVILRKALTNQKRDNGYNIDIDAVIHNIMVEQYDSMPTWAQKQAVATGRKMTGMDMDILTSLDKKRIKLLKANKSKKLVSMR